MSNLHCCISDDLSAELIQERAKQCLETATGLLSKSADSDTLIVDLVKDRLTSRREEAGGTEDTNIEDVRDDVDMKKTEVKGSGLCF